MTELPAVDLDIRTAADIKIDLIVRSFTGDTFPTTVRDLVELTAVWDIYGKRIALPIPVYVSSVGAVVRVRSAA